MKKKKHDGERERLKIRRFFREYIPSLMVSSTERSYVLYLNENWSRKAVFALVRVGKRRWQLHEYFPEDKPIGTPFINYKEAVLSLKTYMLLTQR